MEEATKELDVLDMDATYLEEEDGGYLAKRRVETTEKFGLSGK